MRKKVIYVVPSIDFFSGGRGGAVSHAIGILDGFTESGLNVSFFAEPNVREFSEEINGRVEVCTIEPRKSFFLKNFFYPVTVFKAVYKRVKREKEPLIVMIRKNTFCLWLFPCLRLLFKRNVLIVAEVNGLSYESFGTSFRDRIIGKIALSINQLMLKGADKVYCVSKALKDSLMDGPFPMKGEKILMIPNGGPNSLVVKEATNGEGSVTKGTNFVFFGKLQPYNEFEVLFSAFEKHSRQESDSKLIIIGNGKMKEFVESESQRVANCFYVGEMSLKEAVGRAYINERSFGLVPLRKGLVSQFLSPIKLYDYFSVGCPVIFSSVEGLEGAVNSAGVGIQYISGDVESLAKAMDFCTSEAFKLEEKKVQTRELYKSHTWKHRMAQLIAQLQL